MGSIPILGVVFVSCNLFHYAPDAHLTASLLMAFSHVLIESPIDECVLESYRVWDG